MAPLDGEIGEGSRGLERPRRRCAATWRRRCKPAVCCQARLTTAVEAPTTASTANVLDTPTVRGVIVTVPSVSRVTPTTPWVAGSPATAHTPGDVDDEGDVAGARAPRRRGRQRGRRARRVSARTATMELVIGRVESAPAQRSHTRCVVGEGEVGAVERLPSRRPGSASPRCPRVAVSTTTAAVAVLLRPGEGDRAVRRPPRRRSRSRRRSWSPARARAATTTRSRRPASSPRSSAGSRGCRPPARRPR